MTGRPKRARPGEHAVRCVQCWHPLREQANPFTDVVPGDWYYSSVLDLYERSLMAGTSGHTFSPAQGTTRAMMVQMLYRLAGMPEAEAPCPFEDVPAGRLVYPRRTLGLCGKNCSRPLCRSVCP